MNLFEAERKAIYNIHVLRRHKQIMHSDIHLPTKLDTILDAPEPLRSALADNFASKESVRLLPHACHDSQARGDNGSF
jgi:hypothetical protein